MPAISVVVPTRSRPGELRNCLEALARQDLEPTTFEVIVVDDGGSPAPTWVVQDFASRLQVHLVSQPHQGPAAARNTGAALASGQWVAFTDDDCRPRPDWLRTWLQVLPQSPQALFGGHTTNALTGNPFATASQMLQDFLYSRPIRAADQLPFFASNNMAMALKDFRLLGGFDPSYRIASEDRDLCMRWMRADRAMVYVPTAVVEHAHKLSLPAFCRQHWNYGRGGWQFHRRRTRQQRSRLRPDPWSFYRNLLACAFAPGAPQHQPRLQGWHLAALLALSQVANALGHGFEGLCHYWRKPLAGGFPPNGATVVTVLHLCLSEVWGGIEEHLVILLQGLDRRRYRLVLVCPPPLALLMQGRLPSDVAVVTHPRAALLSWRGPGLLARAVRDFDVDVVHSHMFRASRIASLAGRWLRVPLTVETQHGAEIWRTGWQAHWIFDRVGRLLVDKLIAVSDANRQYLLNKGIEARKIHLIHNGCRSDAFRALPPPGSAGRVLMVGRLEPEKGHDILLRALALVRADFPAVRLICVGDGSLRTALERQATRLGVSDVVRFVGHQDDVPHWMGQSDVVVLPSYSEGFPLVALEALAAGRALVATRVGGTPEVVRHQETGLLVPPGDPAALAAALCRLLGNADWAQAMGRAGQAYVARHFTAERQVTLTDELYRTALGRRRTCSARPESQQVSVS